MLWINSFFDSWSFIAGSPTDFNLFSSVGEISFLIKEYCSLLNILSKKADSLSSKISDRTFFNFSLSSDFFIST